MNATKNGKSYHHVNGTNKIEKSKRPVSQRQLDKRLERMRTELQVGALESLYSWMDPNGFGGSDALERIWRQKGVSSSGEVGWVPLNLVSDRKEGRKWPLWTTEVELNGLRAQSRLAYEDNPYATGLVNSIVNYAVGKGFSYKFQLKMPNDPVQAAKYKRELTEQNLMIAYRELVNRCQKWLDDFLQRNNWTSSQQACEDETKITATREVEAGIRSLVDGDCVFRIFALKGGRAAIRFVEPVRICNPAGARYEDGWSFGVKSAIHEMADGTFVPDEETIVAINIANQDEIELQENPGDGVEVDAEDIVWLAPKTEAANVKRATPMLSFGLLDALNRAYQIQSNASKSAAWRAATVEIWKHLQGTQAGVQSIAAANGTTTTDASGQQRITQKLVAPSIRDIGPGKEPVTPTSVGYPEFLDVGQGDMRMAAAPNQVPEFMISGNAQNNDYASIKEAGSPFFVFNTIMQEHFKRAFSAVIRKALKIAIKAGLLPKEVLTILELIVEAPKDDTRSPMDRASEDVQLAQAKIKSPQTSQAERGLDSEQEFQNFTEFEDRFGPDGQGNAQGGGGGPGMEDGLGGMMDESGGQDGAPGQSEDDLGAEEDAPEPVLASREDEIDEDLDEDEDEYCPRRAIVKVESLESTEALEECLAVIRWTGTIIDAQGRYLDVVDGDPQEHTFLESIGADYDPELCLVILEEKNEDWEPLKGKRGVKKGQQVGWINSKGRKVYGTKKPGGTRQTTAKKASGNKTTQTQTQGDVHSTIENMLSKGANTEDGKKLLGDLAKLSVAQLKAIKQKYNLSTSGRLKGQLIDGIANSAQTQGPQGAHKNALDFANNVDKIRLGEKETGVPWVQRVMDYMPTAMKDYNVFPDTSYEDRWNRLKNGDFPPGAIEALLDNPELKHDYGTMTPEQLADVLPFVDYSKWATEGGGKQLKTGGTATDAGKLTDEVIGKLKKKKPEYAAGKKPLPAPKKIAPRAKGLTAKEKVAKEFNDNFDKIRWKEQQGGGPWIGHVLAMMPVAFKDQNIFPDTPMAERWARLKKDLAFTPEMAKLLGNEEFSHDHGSLTPAQFVAVLPSIKFKATGNTSWKNDKTGAKGQLSEGTDHRTEAERGFMTDEVSKEIGDKNPQYNTKVKQAPGSMSDEVSAKAIQKMLDKDKPFNPIGAKFEVGDKVAKLAEPVTEPKKPAAAAPPKPAPAAKEIEKPKATIHDIAARAIEQGTAGKKLSGDELNLLQEHLYTIKPDEVRKMAETMKLPNARNLSRTKAIEAIFNLVS